jgi:hypothetical protein
MEGEFLSHHGIKNQKWGVRRFQNYDGTLTEEGKLRYGSSENFSEGSDRKTEKKWKKTDASKLTDEELRTRINRLQNEATYKRLLTELDTPQIKKAKEHPIFKQIFVSTAITALSSIMQTMYSNKFKDIIANRLVSDKEQDIKEYAKKAAKRNLVFSNKGK